MAMTRKKKLLLAAIPALFLLLFLWQGGRYLWLHNYALGTRTGVLRKISVKGPPVCKYLLGELVLIGNQPGQAPELWEFSVYDYTPGTALMQALEQAQKSARPVTLRYQQNKARWWACAPTEYYVTGVE